MGKTRWKLEIVSRLKELRSTKDAAQIQKILLDEFDEHFTVEAIRSKAFIEFGSKLVRWNSTLDDRLLELRKNNTDVKVAEIMSRETGMPFTASTVNSRAGRLSELGKPAGKNVSWNEKLDSRLGELWSQMPSKTIAEIFKSEFNIDVSADRVRDRARRLGFKKPFAWSSKGMLGWTPKIYSRVEELVAARLKHKDIAIKINNEFGTSFTAQHIRTRASLLGAVREMHTEWTPERKARLNELALQGLGADEMAAIINAETNSKYTSEGVRVAVHKFLETDSRRLVEKRRVIKDVLALFRNGRAVFRKSKLNPSEMLRLMQSHFLSAKNPLAYKRMADGELGKSYAQLYIQTLDHENAWTHGAHGVIRLALQDAVPGSELLDIASGPGTLATAFKQQGRPAPNITHVDINPHFIALGQKLHPEHEFKLGSADALSKQFAPGRFDFATLLFGLAHLKERERVQALREAHIVLKPGARLVLTEPDGMPFSRNFRKGVETLGYTVLSSRPVVASSDNRITKVNMLVLRKDTETPGRAKAEFFRFPTLKQQLESMSLAELRRMRISLQGRISPTQQSNWKASQPQPVGRATYAFGNEKGLVSGRGENETPGVPFYVASSEEQLLKDAVKNLSNRGVKLHFLPWEPPKSGFLSYAESQRTLLDEMKRLRRR